MVEAADFRELHDLPGGGKRDRPEVGGVLVEREVGARPMVVREVRAQDASQVPLAKDEDMVEACAAARADEPLGELLAQDAVLEGELAVAADEEGEQPGQVEHEGNHER